MTHEDAEWTTCDYEEGCESMIRSHAWGRIKADEWFFMKDGRAFCPAHTPSWLGEWRSRKAERR